MAPYDFSVPLFLWWEDNLPTGSQTIPSCIYTTPLSLHRGSHTHSIHVIVARLNWGARDAWSNAPQLTSCNYFVGPWCPFIIGLPYDHLHSWQTLIAKQRPTKPFVLQTTNVQSGGLASIRFTFAVQTHKYNGTDYRMTYMILDLLVSPSSLKFLDHFPVSMATSNVESRVSIPILSVDKSFSMVPFQEWGHKVRVTPIACVVQWRLEVLRRQNCSYMYIVEQASLWKVSRGLPCPLCKGCSSCIEPVHLSAWEHASYRQCAMLSCGSVDVDTQMKALTSQYGNGPLNSDLSTLGRTKLLQLTITLSIPCRELGS